MATKIQPTIGRKVWFTPHKESNLAQLYGLPLDASICCVHPNGLVNVAGFDALGYVFRACEVELIQEGEPKPADGSYVEWMPYQVKQAAGQDAQVAGKPAPTLLANVGETQIGQHPPKEGGAK
jgi:hypothetical protein